MDNGQMEDGIEKDLEANKYSGFVYIFISFLFWSAWLSGVILATNDDSWVKAFARMTMFVASVICLLCASGEFSRSARIDRRIKIWEINKNADEQGRH